MRFRLILTFVLIISLFFSINLLMQGKLLSKVFAATACTGQSTCTCSASLDTTTWSSSVTAHNNQTVYLRIVSSPTGSFSNFKWHLGEYGVSDQTTSDGTLTHTYVYHPGQNNTDIAYALHGNNDVCASSHVTVNVTSSNSNAIGNQSCYSNTPRLGGLLTTPNLQSASSQSIGGGFGNSNGQCITNAEGGITSFNIPTFNDLKNIYFDRANPQNGTVKITNQLTGNGTVILGGLTNPSMFLSNLAINNGCPSGTCNILYYLTSTSGTATLDVEPNPIGGANQSAVFFVNGDLDIGHQTTVNSTCKNGTSAFTITYNNPPGASHVQNGTPPDTSSNNQTDLNTGGGLIFIVSGQVHISWCVDEFDGFIIAQGSNENGIPGSVFTNWNFNFANGTGRDAAVDSFPSYILNINGGLVNLDSNYPTDYSRNLIFRTNFNTADPNSVYASEVVNFQPKYLVLMRNLFSTNLNIQTEGTNYAINQ